MASTQAAMGLVMKVADVLLRALKERQPWIHVAEVLGVSGGSRAHTEGIHPAILLAM